MRVKISPVWHLATVAKHDVNSDVTRSRKMVATTTSPTPTNEISTDDVTPTRTAGEGLEPRPPHPTPSKWKNGRIATKIGTKTKFGTANSKIQVPKPKNFGKWPHPLAPPLKIQSCRIKLKFGIDTKSSTENSKILVPASKNDDVTTNLTTVAKNEK